MTLDDDLQALFDSEDATICSKISVYQTQAQRNELARVAEATSEENMASDIRQQAYMTAFAKACDLRRQQMSTATSTATEDDIINDIDRITKRLYAQAIIGLTAL